MAKEAMPKYCYWNCAKVVLLKILVYCKFFLKRIR